ncbi:hypothetical protein M431DRAFT_468934 [Trichoderma harzianum CBS 226.95]|uniref:Uncharacterized protein n=1 Tax=Trichoderma harzianum CBS 226.95 TaxID=983964 RepID=A0A2T4A6H0_TRIHA|nr:hypothetical protein M431DRAFT_468934 [Trichoderma harzianum CBS 226.95]PTB52660.1 hypothetical protein M431DRAFT_468934 [Trichoderma harzianum CBS 226.95]
MSLLRYDYWDRWRRAATASGVIDKVRSCAPRECPRLCGDILRFCCVLGSLSNFVKSARLWRKPPKSRAKKAQLPEHRQALTLSASRYQSSLLDRLSANHILGLRNQRPTHAWAC